MATMTQGQAVTLLAQFYDFEGGPPKGLSSLSIEISSASGGTIYLPATSTGIVPRVSGTYSYTWAPDVPPPPGNLLVSWTGTDIGGSQVSSSEVLSVSGPPTANPTQTESPVLLDDRLYVSRYATQQVGFTVIVGGTATDVDGNTVTCYDTNAVTQDMVFSRSADRLGTGIYGVTLSGVDTSVIGSFDLTFSYQISGVQDLSVVPIQVGPTSPAYDALDGSIKLIVENIWQRFADMFDSPEGGPYLQTLMQSKFTRNRIAQLLRIAVGRMNTIAQPISTYAIDDPDNVFPVGRWGALLEQAGYVEVIKHLMRSYTEQPSVNLSASVSRLDRRDYMSRWGDLYAVEKADLDLQLDNFKIQNMGLGQSAVLVSGGAFGRFGPTVSYGGAGEAAARGYFPARYFG